MTPGNIRANKSRSNTAYQNYETKPNSETPWKTTTNAGATDYGVISEEDKNQVDKP